MISLFVSLALLGLSAIDPIGIGIMPILLAQKHPYRRVLIFLLGSFTALVTMGIAFARGLGQVALRFEQHNSWFVPTAELASGVLLLLICLFLYLRLKAGHATDGPTAKTQQWLKFGSVQLFTLGAVLVAVQSVIDLVFVIAMVRVGQYDLSLLAQFAAASTYAISALAIQIAIVIAFKLAPPKQKTNLLAKVHKLLTKYSNQAMIIISLALGIILIILALK